MASLNDLLERDAPAAEVLARLQSHDHPGEGKVKQSGRLPLHRALFYKYPPKVVTAAGQWRKLPDPPATTRTV